MPYMLALSGLAILTAIMFALGNYVNPITVALVFLLFILFLATVFGSKPAVFASILAMLCFNYFFLPPFGTLTIADPQNWIALFAFFVVAITAGQLSAKAKRRAEEAERLYRELQEAFEKTSQAEALKQSEKLKSALLDAVTHDLRTPLTSIKASVTMLLEESQENDVHITLEPHGREELLEIINEETDRLNGFVESMVEVAQLETGDFHWRKTPTEVEEIIQLESHCHRLRCAGSTFRVAIPSRRKNCNPLRRHPCRYFLRENCPQRRRACHEYRYCPSCKTRHGPAG